MMTSIITKKKPSSTNCTKNNAIVLYLLSLIIILSTSTTAAAFQITSSSSSILLTHHYLTSASSSRLDSWDSSSSSSPLSPNYNDDGYDLNSYNNPIYNPQYSNHNDNVQKYIMKKKRLDILLERYSSHEGFKITEDVEEEQPSSTVAAAVGSVGASIRKQTSFRDYVLSQRYNDRNVITQKEIEQYKVSQQIMSFSAVATTSPAVVVPTAPTFTTTSSELLVHDKKVIKKLNRWNNRTPKNPTRD